MRGVMKMKLRNLILLLLLSFFFGNCFYQLIYIDRVDRTEPQWKVTEEEKKELKKVTK